MRATAVQILGLALWAVVWHLRWPDFGTWPRLALALALFSLPGMALARLLQPGLAAVSAAVLGLVFQTALVGALGLAGSLLRWPFRAVYEVFWAAGAVTLALAARHLWRSRSSSSRSTLASLPLLLTALLAARLCLAPFVGDDDDVVHMARIKSFQGAAALGFEDFVFGSGRLAPPRFWLSFWPLSKAILANLSGVEPVEVMAVGLAPLLALASVAAVVELGRSLGLSEALARLAAPLQLLAVLLVPGGDQAGGVFFNRLAEDKATAAFLIAPIFLALVARTLEAPSPRGFAALAGAGLGLLFTHPTVLGMTCVIAAACAGLDFVVRRRRAALYVVALVLALPIGPASFRFTGLSPHHLHFTVNAAEEAGELGDLRRRRLAVDAGGRYAVSPEIWAETPFLPIALAALVALLRPSDPAARLVAASALVMFSTVIPQTAWVLGRAATPFQIWRVFWLAPFGVATTLLWREAREFLIRRPISPAGPRHAAAEWLALLAAGLTALPLSGRARLQALPLPPRWSQVLYSSDDAVRRSGVCSPTFSDLRAIGAALDSLLPEPGVVIGDDRVNNLLPALSARVRLVTFRTSVQTALLGAFDAEQAALRHSDWEAMIGRGAAPERRFELFERYRVRFLLSCGDQPWLVKLRSTHGERLAPRLESGDLRLFEVRPAGGSGA